MAIGEPKVQQKLKWHVYNCQNKQLDPWSYCFYLLDDGTVYAPTRKDAIPTLCIKGFLNEIEVLNYLKTLEIESVTEAKSVTLDDKIGYLSKTVSVINTRLQAIEEDHRIIKTKLCIRPSGSGAL